MSSDHNKLRKGFTDTFKYFAEKTGYTTEGDLAELLFGDYPNLNYKEFVICRIIADTLWDFDGYALHNEVQARSEQRAVELFGNTRE